MSEKIIAIFQEAVPEGVIVTIDSTLPDLHLDSMEFMQAGFEVESACGRDLKSTDFESIQTVRDLVTLMEA